MKEREFYLRSSDGRNRLHGVMWLPDGKPRAVIQISHGMTEHIERYHEFAEVMTDHGIAVYGHDHLGHGKTVHSEADLGFFSEQGGAGFLVRDLRRMTGYGKKKFPGIPLILLGHSMGSFITRRYLNVYDDGPDGVILMGTGGQGELPVLAGYLLSSAVAAAKGSRFRSRLIHELSLGNYSRRFFPPRTGHDWLSRDVEKVHEYEADPSCSFLFTTGAYRDFFRLILETSRSEKQGRIRRGIPVLFLSGSADPVGENEKGVRRVYRRYARAGIRDLTLGFYRKARHELLNETNRKEVYGDILDWLKEHISVSSGGAACP